MKICRNCRYWTWKFKGFCYRQNRGVGQFWSCAEWVEDPPLNESQEDYSHHSYFLPGLSGQHKIANQS
ncbi:MAG: hypothetical protein PHW74_11210 [Desulfobacca sp.]|nr:hypothetical protein [Desulfobacca sp.]